MCQAALSATLPHSPRSWPKAVTWRERKAARTLARKLGVLADVEFPGEERQIERVLAQSDLLLSTSEFEGFGLAPLEAMAAGLPVVATRAGGISEVVKDGVTGKLAEIGDVEGLAARMGAFIENPLVARRMGLAGRRRAVRHFAPERIVPLYEQIYERLARRSGPGAALSLRSRDGRAARVRPWPAGRRLGRAVRACRLRSAPSDGLAGSWFAAA
jgi:glycosyltransferase involved in cell wall biosynthesis